MPDWNSWGDTAVSVGILVGSALTGLLAYWSLFWLSSRIARRTKSAWDGKTLVYLAPPARLLFPLFAVRIGFSALRFTPAVTGVLSHILTLLFIASFSLLLAHLIYLFRDFLLSRYDLNQAGNYTARKMHTQIGLLEKTLLSLVALATVAFMLMTFDEIRHIGVSLLASAGIAGIIIGFAAQKSIGTLLAGIQIAITQPMRIDDVVIVEGEWGIIEEINLTYVVVKIWDLRRLVVPISYFIEKPFQNWTRTSADLLGSVYMYLDYGVPVEALRQEADRFVRGNKLWDGKVCGVQVTDCKPTAVEVRLLVSAASAGDSWDLRCQLRERMIEFVRSEYPGSLPRMRAEMIQASA
jgi:small-conductance mechanosensitive channel